MVKKYNLQNVVPTGKFRSILSQSVACLPSNILLLDLGMAISFGTITVPDLLNAKDGLSMNDVQASWFGSIVFLGQPIGAIFSGPLVDIFGRKKGNLVANIPHIIAWTLIYFSWNLPSLFMANALLGLGTGLMEAPISCYVGEVTHPEIRGAMCSFTQAWASIGIFLIYFLGSVVTWRVAALISLIFPISSMLLVLLAPETPIWLLSRGRDKEALESLCYLRGWTSPDNVKDEFDALLEYSKELKQCVICAKKNTGDTESSTQCQHIGMNALYRSVLKFRYVMLCQDTLRPFTLLILYFMFLIMSGLYPVRPNMVNVCQAFGMADGGKHVVVIVGVLMLFASIIVSTFIRLIGKRKLAVSAMFFSSIFSAALSYYASQNVSDSVFSYNTETFPKTKSYLPLVLFYFLSIFTGLAVPWVLLGEVFPFKSRGTAQGLAAAGNYVITFVASKTFIDMEMKVHLWGAFAVYATFALAGTVYLYLYLPETEGKSLQEIEEYFKGEQRIFADDPFINSLRRLKR